MSKHFWCRNSVESRGPGCHHTDRPLADRRNDTSVAMFCTSILFNPHSQNSLTMKYKTNGLFYDHMTISSHIRCPHGLTLTWQGRCDLCLCHKPTELAHSFLFCSCVCFCLYGPFNCILFHKFSRQLSVFSLCSCGLSSALLVLSTVFIFVKVSFGPDIIPSG